MYDKILYFRDCVQAIGLLPYDAAFADSVGIQFKLGFNKHDGLGVAPQKL
jgi:hypothetical protein